MVELFRDFWWLMFPMFGMLMAVIHALKDNARQDAILRDARTQLERKP
ncbi:MAG: hypothetical protein J0L81_13220 [Caulobacterales bacterium]|jgi:hypothetical protein|nr:hypothetical protein [Caulobacterales bacterium]